MCPAVYVYPKPLNKNVPSETTSVGADEPTVKTVTDPSGAGDSGGVDQAGNAPPMILFI